MQEQNGFSLYEQIEAINQELEISYTPSSSTTRYTYEIIKDGEVYETNMVAGAKTTMFYFQETGEYQIVLTIYQGRKTETVESGLYHIDMDAPIIRMKDNSNGSLLQIEQPTKNTTIDFNQYVIAYDVQDGDLQNQITSNASELDLTKIGNHELIYTVTDRAGNTTSKTVTLQLVANQRTSLLGIQIGLLFLVGLIGYRIYRYQKSIRLEHRISKYSIQGVRNHSVSVFETFTKACQKWNQKFAKILEKSSFLRKYSRRYEKYIPLYRPFYQSGMDAVATKWICGIGFIFIAIISMAIQYHIFASYELLIPFLFGFFLPDLLYFSKYKIYRNTLENDLLQAIMIMKIGRAHV